MERLMRLLHGNKEGQFRTIEGRAVFMGGPGSGGGGASAGEQGKYPSSGPGSPLKEPSRWGAAEDMGHFDASGSRTIAQGLEEPPPWMEVNMPKRFRAPDLTTPEAVRARAELKKWVSQIGKAHGGIMQEKTMDKMLSWLYSATGGYDPKVLSKYQKSRLTDWVKHSVSTYDWYAKRGQV